MLKSYTEAISFFEDNGLMDEFKMRINKIADEAWKQDWFNKSVFEKLNNN